jgi:hypothetical protein
MLRKLYKLFSFISDVNSFAPCGIQQVMVESSQQVFLAAEEQSNSGFEGSIAAT